MDQRFFQDGARLIRRREAETIWIEPWGPSSLRVRVSVTADVREGLPGALLPQPPARPNIVIDPEEKFASITHGAIGATISRDGHIRFTDQTGAVLLEETPIKVVHPRPRSFRSLGGDLFRIEQRFAPQAGERFFGLGQHRHGRLDQKGCVIDLVQRNCEVAIPLAISNRRYGFLWNMPGAGKVELGHTLTRWIADGARQIDYWVTTGDSYQAVMGHYADATGHAPLLPHFASGFWQCKLRYETQEQLLAVAREHRKRGLPLSVIVIDYFHWPAMGDWCFDPQAWPDPQGMVEELKSMGVELMVSVWPAVNPLSKNYEPLRRQGFLLRTERGVPVLFRISDTREPRGTYVHYYDPTNPAARAYVWQQIRENYGRYGIRVFWLDACEPEIEPIDLDNLRYHLGNGLEVGCLYPLAHAQGFYEGLTAQGEREIITLCRSAWAGSQRFGAAVWSGDIDSTFESLAAQIPAGINMGMSGIPWWTTDIGGFHGGDPQSPAFRELLVRWFEFGVFCPLTRLHGHRLPHQGLTGGPNEVWSYGEEVYRILVEQLQLRERLRPYLMRIMREAHESGSPPMRGLFYEFPDDPQAYEVADQFLCGPDVLVAPILEHGARQRRVYLPQGAQVQQWTCAWTGQTAAPGATVTAAAPLERIPVYLRDGANVF